jgi:hypothetical protein
MASGGKLISVPKTPKESFNPDRIASALLVSQILHLREALSKHAAEVQALLAIEPKNIKTERQVSDFVHKATSILHLYAAKPPGK